MDFEGFEKIVDSPARWKLDDADRRRLDRARWVVTEKVHGACFCLIPGPEVIECASRKALLGPEADFFGHRQVVRALEEPLWRLRALLVGGEVAGVRVFGELYGGRYPHPEVAAVPGAMPVQTGIWYSPQVRFVAFDVALVDGAGRRRYMDAAPAREALERAGVPTLAPLLEGRWSEALAFELGFDSTLPAALGLPPLPEGSNPAEGVVLRPAEAFEVVTPRGALRPLLKRKIPAFAEDRRFHEAARWEPPSGAGDLTLLEWELLARVGGPRVASAVSKLGPGSGPVWARRVGDEVIEDVWSEVAELMPEALAGLDGESVALLRAVLEDEARAAVASHQPPAAPRGA